MLRTLEMATDQRLTPREREVLRLLAGGARGTEVAERLGLSGETVRTHIRNAMRKLGARTRIHAAVLATRAGVLDEDAGSAQTDERAWAAALPPLATRGGGVRRA